MSCVRLSEESLLLVYPLGLWSRFSGVVNVLLFGYASRTFGYIDV